MEALTGPQESIEAMRKVFQERRNLVVDMLNKAPGLNCHKPEGAFYVYPSIHGCIGKTTRGGAKIADDESFVMALLEEDRRRRRARRGVLLSRAISASLCQRDTRKLQDAARASGNSAKAALMPDSPQRLGRVQVAACVQMTIRARELRAQGVDIVSLTIGEPNFASPRHAIEAAHQAALQGETKYPPQDGTPALKQAIQRKFKRDSGLDSHWTRSASPTAASRRSSTR